MRHARRLHLRFGRDYCWADEFANAVERLHALPALSVTTPPQDHVILIVPAPHHNAVAHPPSMTDILAEPSPRKVSHRGR